MADEYKIDDSLFEDFDLSKYLTKSPPSDSSFTTMQEIKELNRIPINEKYVEEKDSLEEGFAKIVGYDNLIPDLINSSFIPIVKLKNHFNRPRPKELAKRLNIPFDHKYMPSMNTPSYPSGHSAQAVLLARVLSDKYPNKKNKLNKYALEVSYSRNVAHEHYRSDSRFGWQIGEDMYKYYKNNVQL